MSSDVAIGDSSDPVTPYGRDPAAALSPVPLVFWVGHPEARARSFSSCYTAQRKFARRGSDPAEQRASSYFLKSDICSTTSIATVLK
mgnify:CR=1 FL=1